jgi:hypothetical protein
MCARAREGVCAWMSVFLYESVAAFRLPPEPQDVVSCFCITFPSLLAYYLWVNKISNVLHCQIDIKLTIADLQMCCFCIRLHAHLHTLSHAHSNRNNKHAHTVMSHLVENKLFVPLLHNSVDMFFVLCALILDLRMCLSFYKSTVIQHVPLECLRDQF